MNYIVQLQLKCDIIRCRIYTCTCKYQVKLSSSVLCQTVVTKLAGTSYKTRLATKLVGASYKISNNYEYNDIGGELFILAVCTHGQHLATLNDERNSIQLEMVLLAPESEFFYILRALALCLFVVLSLCLPAPPALAFRFVYFSKPKSMSVLIARVVLELGSLSLCFPFPVSYGINVLLWFCCDINLFSIGVQYLQKIKIKTSLTIRSLGPTCWRSM